MGFDDFFCQEKVLKFAYAQFCGLTFGLFFSVQFVSFVKRKVKSTIEQQKCICHEIHDRLLV